MTDENDRKIAALNERLAKWAFTASTNPLVELQAIAAGSLDVASEFAAELREWEAWCGSIAPHGVVLPVPKDVREFAAMRVDQLERQLNREIEEHQRHHEAEDETKHSIANLLARIHRDGGHYVERHGLAKAIEDAEGAVVAGRAAREDAGRDIRERCALVLTAHAELLRLDGDRSAEACEARMTLMHAADLVRSFPVGEQSPGAQGGDEATKAEKPATP